LALLLLVCPVGAPTSQARGGQWQIESVREALARGAYAEAERYATELTASTEQQYGPDSLELARARDLLIEALIKNGRGNLPATLELAEAAVQLKERLVGQNDLDTAVSLLNVGAVRAERGEFTTAVPIHERALRIRQARLPATDPAIAESLELEAAALIRSERFDEARRALMQSQAIREPRSDVDPIGLARTLELLGWLERYSGNYTAAVPLVQRALAIRQLRNPEHPDITTTFELRGDLMWLRGDLHGARTAWDDALVFVIRTLGPEHPIAGGLERKVAMAAYAFGDQREARRAREHALQVAERALAPCHPEVPKLLNDLAVSFEDDGEYPAAHQMFQRAETTYAKCLGSGHSLVAAVVNNEAELAESMGDFREAERLHARAVTMWSAALGPNHPFVANGLDAIAGSVALRGQRARARALYRRALDIRQRAQGSDHPDVAWTLGNLARTQIDSGLLSAALANLERAIGIYRRAGASDQPDHLARLLELRAEIEARLGDYNAARSTLAETLAIRERTFGKTHPLAAQTRVILASRDFAVGDGALAFESALQGERDGRDHFRYTIRYLPERQAMLYSNKHPRGLDLALSILAAGQVRDSSRLFDAVIQSRGVILDELAARAQFSTGAAAGAAPLAALLTVARERFANLVLRSLQADESVPRALLDEVRQQKEDAERTMAERSAAARTDLARARAGLDDVRQALPSQSVLVSFTRYDRSIVARAPTHTRLQTVPSYIAFVIRSDVTDIVAVPLGAASAIERAVAAWRDQTAGGSLAEAADARQAEAAYRNAGAALRRRIWDPIAIHLGDATHVFIVPDGGLNLVSFAALPTGARGYLAESPRTVHYLSTERDVLPGGPRAATGGLLAVGGAAFDTKQRTGNVPTSRTSGVRRSGCGSLASVRFEDLPGSRDEVADIARVWSSNAGDSLTVLTGSRATETAVKQAISGRQIVHLATHGFFLGSGCESAPAGTRAVGGLASSKRSSSSPQLENPLLLSGIALSGANNHVAATTGEDDGILTAEEVASLNLQSTDWAVLSACDTGVGEVKVGEGVFGLRRAFQIAGARTVIMSLWSVDDQAARQWMHALYRDRLEQRMTTADAVHDATLSVLRARRAKGLSTHPFYWGGFVGAGDWR